MNMLDKNLLSCYTSIFGLRESCIRKCGRAGEGAGRYNKDNSGRLNFLEMAATTFPIPHALLEPRHSPIKRRGVCPLPLNMRGPLWVHQPIRYGGNDTI